MDLSEGPLLYLINHTKMNVIARIINQLQHVITLIAQLEAQEPLHNYVYQMDGFFDGGNLI